jgi:hypothetical protein
MMGSTHTLSRVAVGLVIAPASDRWAGGAYPTTPGSLAGER